MKFATCVRIEVMMFELSDTRLIDGFDDYVITKAGDVVNVQSGLLRKPSRTQAGAIKITLFLNGKPRTKSLSLVVAKAWVYNDHDPEIFDTPIHLDNDPSNVHADNLMWRPRWFAVKYHKQYWQAEYRYSETRVIDDQTGDEYKSLVEVCQKFGFLYVDVLNSCTRNEYVFPSYKIFRFDPRW